MSASHMSEDDSEIVWDTTSIKKKGSKKKSSRASPPPGGIYKILIDGDIVAYRSSTAAEKRVYIHPADSMEFTYKKDVLAHCMEKGFYPDDITFTYVTEDVSHALHNVKTTINTILEALVSGYEYAPADVKIYLSGSSNFRDKIYPNYKGNRYEIRRPTHLDACKQYLVDNYTTETSIECEADDLMAIEAHKDLSNSIIVSLDKDLQMVPCLHYNWVKGGAVTITSPLQGLLTFYRQLLTGDTTDNIPGIKGVGPKTAEKILPEPLTEWEMYRTVLMEYIARGGISADDEGYAVYVAEKIQEVSRNARLLWMQTYEGEMWQPPAVSKEEMPDAKEK